MMMPDAPQTSDRLRAFRDWTILLFGAGSLAFAIVASSTNLI